MPESYVQTNINVTAGAKMKTFETVDGGGDNVQSEAIVLVDAASGNPYAPALEGTLQQVDAAVTSIQASVDVNLSTRASEATVSAIAAMLVAALNTLGQKPMAGSMPVVIASDQSPVPVTFSAASAALQNGAETVVDATVGGVQLIAANANRKGLIIQNTGTENIRVGVAGVTNTTGFRLTPGATASWSGDGTPTTAIFAIREGLVDSIGFAQEET
jgi:hypothetical protein